MIALVSDLHSNREALEAVLAAIAELGEVKEIVCLGDIVGYGPDPEVVVDLVRQRTSFALMGNHDEALFREATDFNPYARRAIEVTRRKMRPGLLASPEKRERWRYLQSLPSSVRRDGLLFVHASPRDPLREYVLATDGIHNPEKMEAVFAAFDGVCFIGHTHHPGIHGPDFRFQAMDGADRMRVRLPPGEKRLVNVGSVGQPRDGDPRACFATFDGESVAWHRVPYDFRTTMERIRATPGLDDILARRLAIGK